MVVYLNMVGFFFHDFLYLLDKSVLRLVLTFEEVMSVKQNNRSFNNTTSSRHMYAVIELHSSIPSCFLPSLCSRVFYTFELAIFIVKLCRGIGNKLFMFGKMPFAPTLFLYFLLWSGI